MTVILNLAQRHAKLANRPKCGFAWVTTGAGAHLCRCVRTPDHANKEHACGCGSSRVKRKGKGKGKG